MKLWESVPAYAMYVLDSEGHVKRAGWTTNEDTAIKFVSENSRAWYDEEKTCPECGDLLNGENCTNWTCTHSPDLFLKDILGDGDDVDYDGRTIQGRSHSYV